MTVKILEVCKMTPPLGSPTDTCLPLTFFDILWLRFPPVESLFFYDVFSNHDTFFSSILPELKHSLSKTLQHFLPVAGNITWGPTSPNPIIRYKKGDGILVTIAQSDADFFHFSSNNFHETNIFQPLIANINESDSQAPLLAIKITLFPYKGLCIGVTSHHAIFDGKSFFMFMKTWSSLSKLGEGIYLNPELKTIFDRKLIRENYDELEKIYVDALLKQNKANPRSLSIWNFGSAPNNVRGAFQLSSLDLKCLKEFVRSQFENKRHEEISSDLHTTTFTVTYAYLMVCLVKAKELSENVKFSIVIDFRDRLEPPLSPNYFGNCVGFLAGDVEREKLFLDNGIIAAVCAVNGAMKSLDDGILKGAENWLSNDTFEEGEKEESTKIMLAGSVRFEPYDIDFGWGRPRKYDNISINKTGAISIIQGRYGDGGVEIELCLKKDEMEKFASAFAQGLAKIKPIKAAL